MINMKRLWIFGDNNSAVFGKTKERRFKYYKEYYKQQNQDYVNSIDFNHKSLNKWFSQFKYK